MTIIMSFLGLITHLVPGPAQYSLVSTPRNYSF